MTDFKELKINDSAPIDCTDVGIEMAMREESAGEMANKVNCGKRI